MRLKIALLCLLVVPWAAFAQEKTFDINDLDWLTGCWSRSEGERETTEHWLRPSGGTMLGVSRTVQAGSTVEIEFMQIRQKASGEIVFIARPEGQPEATFKITKGSNREVVFENPKHDFPQRIIYRLETTDAVVARIEGVSKGKEKSIDFPMTRARCEE